MSVILAQLLMTVLLGFINAGIFILLGAIHIYWGVGGKWGMKQALPQNIGTEKPVFLPGIVACFIVALGLFSMAFLTLNQADIININLPNVLKNYGMYAIGTIFILRAIGDFKYAGFFKKIRDTEFGKLDTLFYTPLCLYLALTSFTIGLNT
jgi:Protein of unknown function (DUF3995)